MTHYKPDGTVESSVSTHSGGPGQFDEDEEYEDYTDEEDLTQTNTQQHLPGHHTRRVRQVLSDASSLSRHHRGNVNRVRSRRQNAGGVKSRSKELERELNCGATQCTVIKCSAGPITSNNHVVFKLRARIWAQTISEVRLANSTVTK